MSASNQHFEFHFSSNSYVRFQETDGIKEGKWSRLPWSEVINTPQIKRLHYNTTKWKHYIIIDIDNADIYKYREQKLPEPNFIIRNKDKVGGHLFYVLEQGIYEANTYYVEMWRQVHKNFTLIAGGDVKAKGYVGKFVYSKHFDYEEIEPSPYNINDLYKYINNRVVNNQAYSKSSLEYIDTTKSKTKPYKANIGQKSLDIVQIGERNDYIFNKVRKFAYIQVLKTTAKNFPNITLQYANELNNNLLAPLEQSEIRATTKSIVKYCLSNKERIKNYNAENAKDRGVMKLQDTELTLKAKQKLAAEYTAEQKAKKTLFKLKLSLIEMRAREMKITQKALAEYSKISLKTVKRYKDKLNFKK